MSLAGYPGSDPVLAGGYGPYGGPGLPPPPPSQRQLGDMATHLYDDLETELKGPKPHLGAPHSFGWMAQDVNPAAPLNQMDDDQRHPMRVRVKASN